MRRSVSEIDQLVGFSCHSLKDQDFRMFHAADMFKGAIIGSNSVGNLENLIYPYSIRELENAYPDLGNASVLKLKSQENMKTSKWYSGVVKSASFKEVPVHSVKIRNAHDIEKVEFYCDCENFSERRFLSEVYSPLLLKEWDLYESYYTQPTCQHIFGVDYLVRELTGVNTLGLNDGLNFIKPHLLSSIDLMKEFPRLSNAAVNFIYFSESSMFNDAREVVNKNIRRKRGLEKLSMHKDPYFKRYVMHKIGINEKDMKRITEIVSY